MKKRISRKVREEAALICAIAASNEGLGIGTMPIRGHMTAARWLGHRKDSRAARLAWDAFAASPLFWSEGYADAESLLRCGWSPGDEL